MAKAMWIARLERVVRQWWIARVKWSECGVEGKSGVTRLERPDESGSISQVKRLHLSHIPQSD